MTQQSAAPAGMFVCRKCEGIWGGMLTCHCTGCHQTFANLDAYDLHRHGDPRSRHCLQANDAGLTLTDRKYPCWDLPEVGTITALP